MKLNEAIIERLKIYLKKNKITQYELFKRSGVPQSTISTILNGKVESILLSTLYQFCAGLNMEFSEFFNDDLLKLENLED